MAEDIFHMGRKIPKARIKTIMPMIIIKMGSIALARFLSRASISPS
jgi:hypothetical protein